MSHRHPPIIHDRYAQGLAAYQSGHSLAELSAILAEIDRLHEAPDLTFEQHDEIEASGPSVIAGFAQGLIEDIRLLADTRRGQRA